MMAQEDKNNAATDKKDDQIAKLVHRVEGLEAALEAAARQ